MQQQSYLLIVINTIILFNSVFASADQEAVCANQTNTDCHTCLSVSNCAFCNDNKKCFYYYENMLQPPCNTSQLQLGTCVGRLIMLFGSLKRGMNQSISEKNV